MVFAGCQATRTGLKGDMSRPDSVVLFQPLPESYASMRIPALILTRKGILLAVAAARAGNGGDWAEMILS